MLATETLARETAKVQKRKSVMVRAVEEFKAAAQETSESRGKAGTAVVPFLVSPSTQEHVHELPVVN